MKKKKNKGCEIGNMSSNGSCHVRDGERVGEGKKQRRGERGARKERGKKKENKKEVRAKDHSTAGWDVDVIRSCESF